MKLREELINKLFDEFEKDKETIKKNLLVAMDSITLNASNKYEKVTLSIKMERVDK